MISKATSIFKLILFLLVTCAMYGQETTKAHKDSLDAVVKKYYELNVKIFQSNSTPKDIDNVFELFTEDFTYVHPKYGGTYTRQKLYDGYIKNQKSGRYLGTIEDIEILNKIIGLNAVVTQKRFVENKDGEIKKGKPEMTLFEFKNGKISRIFEYW